MWSGHTLNDSARCINAVVQPWVNYHGRYFRSELSPLPRRINFYLARGRNGNTNG